MRSGAKVKMHPFRDDLSKTCDVVFYRVEERPCFPWPTCFVFDQWLESNGQPDEFPGFEHAYQYYNGFDDWHFTGDKFSGTEEQWANGCLTTDLVEVNPDTGQPTCCDTFIRLQTGGFTTGGNVLVDAPQTQVGGELQGGFPKATLLALEVGGELQGGTGLYNAARVFVGGEEHGGTAYGTGLVVAVGGELHGGDAWGVSTGLSAGGEEQGGKWISQLTMSRIGGEEHGGSSTSSSSRLLAGGEEQGGSATVSWGGTAGAWYKGGEEQGGAATVAIGPTTILNSGGTEEGGTATVTRSDVVIQAAQYTGSTINAQVLLFELSNPNGLHGNFHIQNTHGSYSINFWWTHTDMDGGVSTYNTNIGPNGFLEIDFTGGVIQGSQTNGWIPFKDVKIYVGDLAAGNHATYNAWVSWIT